jgi:Domain of unknown function (DUF4349)
VTVTDAELERLLSGAAGSFAVPEEGASAVLRRAEPGSRKRPPDRSRWLAAAAGVVAVLCVGAIAVGTSGGNGTSGGTTASSGGARDSGASVPGPALAPDLAGPGVSAPETAAGGRGAAVGTATARVVKTGTLVLAVGDGQVPATVTAATRAAQAVGGYVQDGSTSEAGDHPTGRLVVRVPAARYEELVARLRGVPGRVVSASTSGEDVTAQYTDLESQLVSLRAARSRFLDILSRAKTVTEVLAVQQRVDEVTAQIDTVEGQRRLLARQSDLGTLDVQVSEVGDEAVAQPRTGLGKAFADARHGFVGGVEALVRISGPLLLVALVLGVLSLVAHGVYRTWRRRLL